MYKKKLLVLLFSLIVVVGFSAASLAQAATPTFSAFYTGNGDYVQMNITNADPNYSVLLNYGSQMRAVGMTDPNGAFSLTISTSQYGITPGGIVSVTVNGKPSNSLQWPYTTGTTGSFSLSPSTLSLPVGQSLVITASVSGPFFLSTNSNPSVANASLNGSQLTITGNAVGTTAMTFCLVSNTASCATATVNVSGGTAQGLTFSQNNITLSSGQTTVVSVSGGTGVYSIISNSNPSSVQATLNGSAISLYPGSVGGSSAITVCSSNMSSCGVITATVNGSVAGALSFSQTNPTIAVGQATTVTVSGGIAPYSVSSNSNSSVAQAYLSSNVLTLSGIAAGSTVLTICSATNVCGTLTVTVNASGSMVSFAQNNITVAVGQNSTVPILGSGSYYISNNANAGIASAILSGSNIVVSGNAAGSDTITVCPTSGSNQCGTLYVVVSGIPTSAGSVITLTHVLSVGQGINLMLSGGTFPYSASSNAASVCSATISGGNVLTLMGVSAGSASITVCASGGTSCVSIPVTVTAALPTAETGTTISTGNKYVFTSLLKYGSIGDEVRRLQEKLTADGVYSGPITGRFGDLTLAAVKRFQSKNGIRPVGYVGPSTRAALNK